MVKPCFLPMPTVFQPNDKTMASSVSSGTMALRTLVEQSGLRFLHPDFQPHRFVAFADLARRVGWIEDYEVSFTPCAASMSRNFSASM